MIDRGNWKLTKSYMEYRRGRGLVEGSLKLEKSYIRYLLEWAKDIPFVKSLSIKPVFLEFLHTHRLDGSGECLSDVSIKKILATSRRFFTWLYEFKPGHSSIKPSWVETLSYKTNNSKPKKRDAITLEEILEISRAPVQNISERRIRAAAVFLFLSGMRISAFVSLPLKAVDIENVTINQFPELGVRTKNNKHASTFLLPIPELIEVVKAWDNEIRPALSPDAYWFAMFSPKTGELDTTVNGVGYHRRNLARRSLKSWLNKVGLPYHTPHSFRHGHIQWGYLNAKKPIHKKAISDNVMHSSTTITDAVYSNLKESELKGLISDLGTEEEKSIGLSDADVDRIAYRVAGILKGDGEY